MLARPVGVSFQPAARPRNRTATPPSSKPWKHARNSALTRGAAGGSEKSGSSRMPARHPSGRCRQFPARLDRPRVVPSAGPRRPRLHPARPVRGPAGDGPRRRLRPLPAGHEPGLFRRGRGCAGAAVRHRVLGHRGRRHDLLHRRPAPGLRPDGTPSPAQLHPRWPQPDGARHLPRDLRLRADGAADGGGGSVRPAPRPHRRPRPGAGRGRHAGLVRPPIATSIDIETVVDAVQQDLSRAMALQDPEYSVRPLVEATWLTRPTWPAWRRAGVASAAPDIQANGPHGGGRRRDQRALRRAARDLSRRPDAGPQAFRDAR